MSLHACITQACGDTKTISKQALIYCRLTPSHECLQLPYRQLWTCVDTNQDVHAYKPLEKHYNEYYIQIIQSWHSLLFSCNTFEMCLLSMYPSFTCTCCWQLVVQFEMYFSFFIADEAQTLLQQAFNVGVVSSIDTSSYINDTLQLLNLETVLSSTSS